MTSTCTIGLVTLLAVNAPIAGQSYLEIDHRDGLPGYNVHAICELADGTIVFGTTHGLAFWREGEITRTFTGPYYDALLQQTGRAGEAEKIETRAKAVRVN